jgi:Cd2+/Zn2+-exporting ATPase
MVLATPTALVASIGNAALRGSLVKKGATIEALAKVDTVVFDKTGTLTFGRPRLLAVVPLNGVAHGDVLQLAAVAEKFSEHPLGQAIVRGAEERGAAVPDPDAFESLPGWGVRAQVDGHQLMVGRARVLTDAEVGVGPELETRVAELAATGRSVVPVAVDRTVAGLLVLEDAVRPEAKATIGRLHDLGLRTVLISGDNRAATERVAAELGIREAHAEVLPAQKVELVRWLQAEGRKVAFVGDGVNDGPALATADIGVAMGLAGTDVAIETAEIALLADDLSKLPHLLGLSRQAIRAIRQNLVFSLGVLAAAVGLTIVGILHPVTGALLHELSSIPVIANSARLIGVREQVARGGAGHDGR